MIDKLRIAFCFSGQARTLDQTYQFFQKNLFDAAKEQWFDYDVFCAVEDDDDVDKVNLLNPTKVEKIKSSEVEKKIKYNVNSDKNLKYFDCDYAKFLPYVTQQQWYKVERSFILKDNYKKAKNISYDIVFRLRFDTYFMNKINFDSILKIVGNEWKIVCNRFFKSPNRIRSICDLYFICDDKSSTELINNMFSKYWTLIRKLVSWRFLFVTLAAKLILLLLKINYKAHYLSNDALLKLKLKYLYGLFVPEVVMYKAFLSKNFKIFESSIKVWLLRKNWQLNVDGKWWTVFEI